MRQVTARLLMAPLNGIGPWYAMVLGCPISVYGTSDQLSSENIYLQSFTYLRGWKCTSGTASHVEGDFESSGPMTTCTILLEASQSSTYMIFRNVSCFEPNKGMCNPCATSGCEDDFLDLGMCLLVQCHGDLSEWILSIYRLREACDQSDLRAF